MLGAEPYLYQLTVHRMNYNIHYGSKSFERDYIFLLRRQDPYTKKSYATMSNYIEHYGKDLINTFLSEIIYVQAG